MEATVVELSSWAECYAKCKVDRIGIKWEKCSLGLPNFHL